MWFSPPNFTAWGKSDSSGRRRPTGSWGAHPPRDRLGVDAAGGRLAAPGGQDLLEGEPEIGSAARLAVAHIVRGEDEPLGIHVAQRARGLQRLVDEGVDGGPGDPALVEGPRHRLLVHHLATRRVDEHRARLHPPELLLPDET